jgi:hypothetical protein
MKQVPVVFFLEPIEVDDEEAAQLARHGLVRDDNSNAKPPVPVPAPAAGKEKTE